MFKSVFFYLRLTVEDASGQILNSAGPVTPKCLPGRAGPSPPQPPTPQTGSAGPVTPRAGRKAPSAFQVQTDRSGTRRLKSAERDKGTEWDKGRAQGGTRAGENTEREQGKRKHTERELEGQEERFITPPRGRRLAGLILKWSRGADGVRGPSGPAQAGTRHKRRVRRVLGGSSGCRSSAAQPVRAAARF